MKKYQKLTRDEMKNVNGGANSPSCPVPTCNSSNYGPGTCGDAETGFPCKCLVFGKPWDGTYCPVY